MARCSQAEKCRLTVPARTANSFSTKTLEELPDAKRQAQVLADLKRDKDSFLTHDYKYAVDNQWKLQFDKYLGNAQGKSPGQTAPPGKITMNKELSENTYISGHRWAQLVQWYGLSNKHQLDRLHEHDTEPPVAIKNIKFAFFNSMIHNLKHKEKAFNAAELVGYVEFQIRWILQVPRKKQSRLWTVPESMSLKAELLADRAEELNNVFKRLPEINENETEEGKKCVEYILALEVQDYDGCWPTGFQEASESNLDFYYEIVEGSQQKTLSQMNYDQKLEGFLMEFKHNVGETIQQTMENSRNTLAEKIEKCKLMYEEADAIKEKYHALLKDVTVREKDLETRENNIIQMEVELIHQKALFLEEKTTFESEKEKCEKLNKITDSFVCVNVGGIIHETSMEILTSYSDCMLTSMFSGRYAIKTLKDGSYFIDRNGEYFKFILDFLRTRELPPVIIQEGTELTEEKIGVLRALLIEADYYNIEDLSYKIKEYLPDHEFPFRFMELDSEVESEQ